MNTMPSGTSPSARTLTSMGTSAGLELQFIARFQVQSPQFTRGQKDHGLRLDCIEYPGATGHGTRYASVRVPGPVDRIIGKSMSGTSSGGRILAGQSLPDHWRWGTRRRR